MSSPTNIKVGGFSLVELMVAVSIIGVLAALALPRYHSMIAQARRGEAKANLAHIASLQSVYKVEHWTRYYGTAMTAGNGIGNGGSCADPATGDIGLNNKLGFSPDGCSELRYFYYLVPSREEAIAYAPSNDGKYIYPDCRGGSPIIPPSPCDYDHGDVVKMSLNDGKPTVCRNITKYCPTDLGGSIRPTPPPPPCNTATQCCNSAGVAVAKPPTCSGSWRGTFEIGCCQAPPPSCTPSTTICCSGDTAVTIDTSCTSWDNASCSCPATCSQEDECTSEPRGTWLSRVVDGASQNFCSCGTNRDWTFTASPCKGECSACTNTGTKGGCSGVGLSWSDSDCSCTCLAGFCCNVRPAKRIQVCSSTHRWDSSTCSCVPKCTSSTTICCLNNSPVNITACPGSTWNNTTCTCDPPPSTPEACNSEINCCNAAGNVQPRDPTSCPLPNLWTGTYDASAANEGCCQTSPEIGTTLEEDPTCVQQTVCNDYDGATWKQFSTGVAGCKCDGNKSWAFDRSECKGSCEETSTQTTCNPMSACCNGNTAIAQPTGDAYANCEIWKGTYDASAVNKGCCKCIVDSTWATIPVKACTGEKTWDTVTCSCVDPPSEECNTDEKCCNNGIEVGKPDSCTGDWKGTYDANDTDRLGCCSTCLVTCESKACETHANGNPNTSTCDCDCLPSDKEWTQISAAATGLIPSLLRSAANFFGATGTLDCPAAPTWDCLCPESDKKAECEDKCRQGDWKKGGHENCNCSTGTWAYDESNCTGSVTIPQSTPAGGGVTPIGCTCNTECPEVSELTDTDKEPLASYYTCKKHNLSIGKKTCTGDSSCATQNSNTESCPYDGTKEVTCDNVCPWPTEADSLGTCATEGNDIWQRTKTYTRAATDCANPCTDGTQIKDEHGNAQSACITTKTKTVDCKCGDDTYKDMTISTARSTCMMEHGGTSFYPSASGTTVTCTCHHVANPNPVCNDEGNIKGGLISDARGGCEGNFSTITADDGSTTCNCTEEETPAAGWYYIGCLVGHIGLGGDGTQTCANISAKWNTLTTGERTTATGNIGMDSNCLNTSNQNPNVACQTFQNEAPDVCCQIPPDS